MESKTYAQNIHLQEEPSFEKGNEDVEESSI